MSDPQDLLYTNKFISNDILTNKDIKDDNTYYDRFINYIEDKNDINSNDYINNNENETSSINLTRTLNQKWPIESNKNHYPLFDTYINDISTNRYKKEVVTKINIDSKYRDLTQYPYPNNFNIEFQQTFNNVKKYVINDIIFPNLNQSINDVSNNIAWQYPSKNYLLTSSINNNIIPVPDPNKQISYCNLPNSAFAYTVTESTNENIVNVDNYLVYQTQITPGYYTIEEFILNAKKVTSTVLHGNNFNNTSVDINTIIEQPYLAYPKRINTPHLFSFNINPVTSAVQIVNRIEEVNIEAIQTFSPYENDFANNDIFYYFSSQYNLNKNYTLDTSYIYITLSAINDITYQYYLNINCIYSPNAFPLVITNLHNNVGNIDYSLLNFTEFYDLNIYLQNGYTEKDLSSISYYKFIDTITITSNNFSKTYLRFGLKLSTGNYNGINYNLSGQWIIPSITDNIIYSQLLNNILKTYGNVLNINEINGVINGIGTADTTFTGNFTNTYSTAGIFIEYKYINQSVLIGRALLYRWIFDKNNGIYVNYEIYTNTEKKRSVLKYLAWPIPVQTLELYTLDINNTFRFVHTNYQSIYTTLSTSDIRKGLNLKAPFLKLNLQFYSNKYYFINESYIYLKLIFNNTENPDSSNQLINSMSSKYIQYNQTYVDDYLFNVNIGEDYNCIDNINNITVYSKNPLNLFAKIILDNIPGNTNTILSNIINNNSFVINYNHIQHNISNVTISLYDSNLRLISATNQNFSFTLNIYEIKDVLKETLINTRTDSVVSTGNFI
jgi:hypothetical protein